MTQLCEMTQIGRVGSVKEVGPNLIVSVASDASYNKNGEWVNKANWIEHTIFGRQEKVLEWVRDNLQPGDLVSVRSTPSQSKYERNGETVYGYTFAVEMIRREVAKADMKAKEAPEETTRGKSRKAK